MEDAGQTTSLDELSGGVNPFNRYTWHGRLVSFDGTDTDDFTADDVAEVIAEGATPDDWEGTAAGVVRLKDGRFVAWETFWGPTGSGFSEDAYGGDADLIFARDRDTVIRFGLTDEGRRLCGLPQPVEDGEGQ